MIAELNEERALRLLQSIDRRLALLAVPPERALRRLLAAEVLRTANRTALWDAIDGERGSPELAKAAGISERFAQVFVNELLELGLVRRVERTFGRGSAVEKDELGVVEWYLGQQPSNETAGE